MRRLTKKETALVLRHADAERERLHVTPGRTLRIAVLRRSLRHGLEVAIAATRRREAKIVASWYPGAKGFAVRDLGYCGYSGYTVDWNVAAWDAEFARTGERPYRYGGGYFTRFCWLSSDTDGFVEWDGVKTCLAWTAGVANPELLSETPYRYCGWKPGCGYNLLEVLHDYAADKSVEYLVKLGVFRETRSASKRRAIRENPALRRIVAKNPALVRECDWRDLVWLSESGRRTPEQAVARTRERERRADFFHSTRFQFPKCIDRAEAFAYCNARDIDAGHYTEAMSLAVQQGYDPHSRSVAFPSDWERFFRERTEARDRQVLAANKDRDAEIAKFVREIIRVLESAKTDTEGYTVYWMTRQLDFRDEGERMHNCIGGGRYSMDMAKRNCVCFVLASEDERVDVAIGSDWKVRECYAKFNKAPRPEAAKVAARIARALERGFAKAA